MALWVNRVGKVSIVQLVGVGCAQQMCWFTGHPVYRSPCHERCDTLHFPVTIGRHVTDVVSSFVIGLTIDCACCSESCCHGNCDDVLLMMVWIPFSRWVDDGWLWSTGDCVGVVINVLPMTLTFLCTGSMLRERLLTFCLAQLRSMSTVSVKWVGWCGRNTLH